MPSPGTQVRYNVPQNPQWQNLLGGAIRGLGGQVTMQQEKQAARDEKLYSLLPTLATMKMLQPAVKGESGAIDVGNGQYVKITARGADAQDEYYKAQTEKTRYDMQPEQLISKIYNDSLSRNQMYQLLLQSNTPENYIKAEAIRQQTAADAQRFVTGNKQGADQGVAAPQVGTDGSVTPPQAAGPAAGPSIPEDKWNMFSDKQKKEAIKAYGQPTISNGLVSFGSEKKESKPWSVMDMIGAGALAASSIPALGAGFGAVAPFAAAAAPLVAPVIGGAWLGNKVANSLDPKNYNILGTPGAMMGNAWGNLVGNMRNFNNNTQTQQPWQQAPSEINDVGGVGRTGRWF